MDSNDKINIRELILLPSEIKLLKKIADGKYIDPNPTADELVKLKLIEGEFTFDNFDRLRQYRITSNGLRYLHWLDTYQVDQIKTDKRARLSLILSALAIGLSAVGLLHQLISK